MRTPFPLLHLSKAPILYHSLLPSPRSGIIPHAWAVGSVVERLVHTEEVTGSNPVLPTKSGPDIFLLKRLVGSVNGSI